MELDHHRHPDDHWLALAFVLCASCSAPAREIAGVAADVIYGADDRIEAFAAPEGPLKSAAERATAAVSVRDDSMHLTFRERDTLCADEAFAGQPTLGFCTAMLVARDVVVTAGHCLALRSCPNLHFVFGFHYREPGVLAQPEAYGCAEVLIARASEADAIPRLDYAFVRLDRQVTANYRPVKLHATDQLNLGDELALVGHGAGLPTKIAVGARVLDARADTRDYFLADVDDFAGGSGSGVFDAQGALIGIAARGEADFEQDGDCLRARHAGDGEGEQITYVSRAIEGLCADPNAPEPCPQKSAASCAAVPGTQSTATFWLLACLAFKRRRRRSPKGSLTGPAHE
jgi:hypothetical protein